MKLTAMNDTYKKKYVPKMDPFLLPSFSHMADK